MQQQQQQQQDRFSANVVVVVIISICFCLNFAPVAAEQQQQQQQEEHVYLKTAPEFLQPCQWREPSSNACLAKSLEGLLTHWKDGIPGLTSIGSLEPFKVKKVRITHDLDNVKVQLQLRNMSTFGLSTSKVLNSTIDEAHYNFAFLVEVPSVKIVSAYRLRGQVLLLNLNGMGTLRAEMSNLRYLVLLRAPLKQIGDERFFNVTAVKTDVKSVAKFHIRLGNLFGGNKELEDSAHELFNGSWRDIFEVLRPVLAQTYDAVLISRFRKIFNYIPARYLFTNLT